MSTFRRYLRFQLMMFVFGIVGPMFLVVYFAVQPDPTMKWAYWTGLFITAADVLIALGLTSSTGPGKPSRAIRSAAAVANRVPQRRGADDEVTSTDQ